MNRFHWGRRWVQGLVLILGAVNAHAGWDGKIVEVATGRSLSSGELAQTLASVPVVIIGEVHYSPAVQIAEGAIISNVVRASKTEQNFTTAWEFLNDSDQAKTQSLYDQLKKGLMDAKQFLSTTQGTEKAAVYSPMIEATVGLGGDLLGVNLSRSEKAPVVQGGLKALNPSLLPPGFEMGGAGYFERFKTLMAGHASPEQMQNYFEAQCLTDDVMAYHLLQSTQKPQRFLIAGSFHVEYFDGVVARFRNRAAAAREAGAIALASRSIRIFDASNYTESELQQALRDSAYGDIADYAYFVNEPTAESAGKSLFLRYSTINRLSLD